MVKLKLVQRTEIEDSNVRQLMFFDVTESDNATSAYPMAMGQGGVNVSGMFPAAVADALVVGATYELAFNRVT